jgi:hypothetical protein
MNGPKSKPFRHLTHVLQSKHVMKDSQDEWSRLNSYSSHGHEWSTTKKTSHMSCLDIHRQEHRGCSNKHHLMIIDWKQ